MGAGNSHEACGRPPPLPRRLDGRWGRISMEQLFDDAFLAKQARRTAFLTLQPTASASTQRRLLLQTSDFQDPLRPSTTIQATSFAAGNDDDTDEVTSVLAETIMALVNHDSTGLARYSIHRLRDSLVRHCDVSDPFANKVNLQLYLLHGMHAALTARARVPPSSTSPLPADKSGFPASLLSSHEAALGVHVFLHLVHSVLGAATDHDRLDVRQEFLADLVPLLQQLDPLSLAPTTASNLSMAAAMPKGVHAVPDVVDTLQEFLLDFCDDGSGGDVAMNALLRLAVARGAASTLLQAVQVLLGATSSSPSTRLGQDVAGDLESPAKPAAPRPYGAKHPPTPTAKQGGGSVLLNRGDPPGEDVVVLLKKKPKPPSSSSTAVATTSSASMPPLHHHHQHPVIHPFAPNKNNCDSSKASAPVRPAMPATRHFPAVDIRPVVVALSAVPDASSPHDVEWTRACDDDDDDEEREVWSCGQNSYGELSHGDTAPRKSFDRVEALQGKSIVHVCAGNEHTVALAADGSVYTCGYNDNGQCGHGVTTRLPTMTEVAKWPDASFERHVGQIHAYNGCEHTVVVAHDGSVASFGYNYRGQLGHGTTTSESLPKRIRGLDTRRVTMVSCSYYHTILSCAATTGGHLTEVYSFGRNDYGQLGHSDTLDRRVPTLVESLSNIPLVALACGQYHSVVATTANAVLAFGKNDYGQLGLEALDNQLVPAAVGADLWGHEAIVDVRCGYYHSIVLCRGGRVYGFGRNDYGQLGVGDAGVHMNQRIATPTVLTDLEGKEIVRIACGCYHTVAVAESGMLYVFGRNNHGQLGTGDTTERLTPCAVDTFVGKRVAVVAAGFYHTVVLTGGKDLDDTPPPLPPDSTAVKAARDHDDSMWTSQAMLDVLSRKKRTMQRKTLSLDPTVDDEDDDQAPPQPSNSVDAAVCVLAHLDRLCRPFIPSKGSYPVLRPDKPKRSSPDQSVSKSTPSTTPIVRVESGYRPYCVDMQSATFDSLSYILDHFFQPPTPSSKTTAADAAHDSHVYVVLAALRLVQANVAQVLKSGVGAAIVMSSATPSELGGPLHPLDGPLKRLHRMLVEWINEPRWLQADTDYHTVRNVVEREAVEALLLGLELFYPCPASQMHLIVSMLKADAVGGASPPSPIPCPTCHTHDIVVPKPRKVIVEPLLRRMADDNLLVHFLRQPTNDTNHNAVTAKGLMSMLLEKIAATTDDLLVGKALQLDVPALRPYVVLLNAMQKQLASWAGDATTWHVHVVEPSGGCQQPPLVQHDDDLPLSWRWFLDYAAAVFDHAADNLHATAPLTADAGFLDGSLNVLEASIVGSIVPSLATTLLLFHHVAPFARTLLPNVQQVLRLVDGLNSYIPAAKLANANLLRTNDTADSSVATPWHVTLERLLVQLASEMAATLVVGDPLHECPTTAGLPKSSTVDAVSRWRQLLRGGLEAQTLSTCRVVPHATARSLTSTEATCASSLLPLPPRSPVPSHVAPLTAANFVALCSWVRSVYASQDASYRFVIKTSRGNVDEIEQAVYRAILKHTGHDGDAGLWAAAAAAGSTAKRSPPQILVAPWALVADCTRTLAMLKNTWQNQHSADDDSGTAVDRGARFRHEVLKRCAFLLDVVAAPPDNSAAWTPDDLGGVALPSDPLPEPSHMPHAVWQRRAKAVRQAIATGCSNPFVARCPPSTWKRFRMLFHVTVRWRRIVATARHQSCPAWLGQIVSFVLDTSDSVDVDDLRRELVRRCRRANSRALGLHTFGDLITFTSHMRAMHTPVLNRLGTALRQRLDGRVLHGLDGVGAFYSGRVLAAFATMLSTVASMVSACDGTHGPRMLAALQCWGFVVEPELYAVVDDIQIVSVLKQMVVLAKNEDDVDERDVAVRGATWAAFRYLVSSGSAQHANASTVLVPRQPQWKRVLDALYAALLWSTNAILHDTTRPPSEASSSLVLRTTRTFAALDRSTVVPVTLSSAFTVQFWLNITKPPDPGARGMVVTMGSHPKEWVPYCSIGDGSHRNSGATEVVLEVGLRQHSFQECVQHVVACQRWLAVAIVYDATALHLFVNGEVVCVKSISSLHLVDAPTPATLTMGKPSLQLDTAWPCTGFDGCLAHLHIHQDARTPVDIAADFAHGPPNALMDRCCYQLGIVSLLLAHSSEGVAELTSPKWLDVCFSLLEAASTSISFRIQQLVLRLLKRLLPYVDPAATPRFGSNKDIPLIPYWMQRIGRSVVAVATSTSSSVAATTAHSSQQGHVALELSHVVMHLATVPTWMATIQAALEAGLESAMAYQRSELTSIDAVASAVGAFYVLGGFVEPLRVGAIVELTQCKDIGTIVSYRAPFAQLVLHKPHKVLPCQTYDEWVEAVHTRSSAPDEFGKTVRLNTDELAVSWREHPLMSASSWALLLQTTVALLHGPTDKVETHEVLKPSAPSLGFIQSSALKALVHGLRQQPWSATDAPSGVWNHPDFLPRLLALATQSDKSTQFCSLGEIEQKVTMVRRRLYELESSNAPCVALPEGSGDDVTCHDGDHDGSDATARKDAIRPCSSGPDDDPDEDDENEDDDQDDDDDEDDEDEGEEARAEFVEELSLMGFPEDWCVMALKHTDNDMMSASAWIVDNLEYLNTLQAAKDKEDNSKEVLFNDEEDDCDDGYDGSGGVCAPATMTPSMALVSTADASRTCMPAAESLVPCLLPGEDGSCPTIPTTLWADADMKETGRKVFGETYFPFEEGGFLSNMSSLFLTVRLGNQPTAGPGTTAATTQSCADALQQFAMELANATDVGALATSLEQSLQVHYARQALALYFATWQRAHSLDESTERLLLVYAKAVLFRGQSLPPPREGSPLEVVLASVLDAALNANIRRVGTLVWATIASELRQACASKYEGVLWTQRDVTSGDESVLSGPSVEFAAWLVQCFFAQEDRLCAFVASVDCPRSLGKVIGQLVPCLGHSNVALKLVAVDALTRLLHCSRYRCRHAISSSMLTRDDLHGLDRNVLVVIARRRQLRELSQNRFFYSPYLQGLLELIRALPPVETPTMAWGLQLVRASETSLTLAWPSPVQPDQGFHRYVLEQAPTHPDGDAAPRVVYSGVDHQCTLSNLTPRTSFTYTLRGENRRDDADGVNHTTSGTFTTKATTDGSSPASTSPFVWDKKKCRSGSLAFSDDSHSVSFNGNEAWRMVLGTECFVVGRHSWQVKVEKSSSAYLFLGVATRRANLESFLGADEHSWGFIGDGALYYQRNRVKTYGEPFGEGDVLALDLDCDLGTLSYSKNGVPLGVAFDNVVGELYPAIAFYTRHQKLCLVPSGYNCTVGLKLQGSPTESTVDEYLDCCAVMEAMTSSTKLPRRLLVRAYDGYVLWRRETRCRVMTRAGYELLFDVSDATCVPLGFKAKDKVKTPRGNGTVVGVADGRLWVETDGESGAAWFFHPSKVRLRGGVGSASITPPAAPMLDPSMPDHSLSLDDFARLVDCDQWTLSQDAKLIHVLNVECASSRTSPWNISHAKVRELVAAWPNVDAAVGRVGVLKMFNHVVSRTMPFFDLTWHYFNPKRGLGSGSAPALLSATRACLFTAFKYSVLDTLLEKTLTHPKKADDDYDYPEDLPQLMVNRPKAAVARFKVDLDTVVSQSLFGQAFDELHFLDNKVLRMVYSHPMDDGQLRTFKVKFEGEGADDYGGPYREFFAQFVSEVQCLKQGTPNWRNGLGSHREKFVLNPTLVVRDSKWNQGAAHNPVDNTALFLEMYHFLGQMLGIMLRTRVLVRLDLSTAIWKQLVGVPLDASDLAEIDTAAFTLLQQLKQLDPTTAADTLAGLDLTFTTHLSDGTLVPVKPDGHGIPVTADNVREYVDLVLHTRLYESASAIDAIKQGLCTIVPSNAVALFTPVELETRLCGRADVDVGLLQANTEYDEDLSADDPYVQRFWRVLVGMSQEDRCAFLRFVSARSRLPQDQPSFGQKFKIQSASGEGMTHNPDDSLPKSHTCFFALLLPKYSSDDVCRKQFLYAIHNCLEMDGDFRLADTEMTGWSDIHPNDALRI
ncbi:hypothetical protein DYB32_002077 [Aphanomyces invadans]|uniref:HECT domain-containing protein n=1 Tax=Aphanomyces invadans TaxID=157072 RepID=A0A418B4I1_9STRA|nr:hypothetical protein DYB32_002077 [Aphanomyces invadans]